VYNVAEKVIFATEFAVANINYEQQCSLLMKRKRTKDGFTAAALETNSFRCRLNEEMSN